jgi:hypothetical protein
VNPHHTLSRLSKRRPVLHCTAFLLLSGFTPDNTLAGSRPRPEGNPCGNWRARESEPYLAIRGAPALRFREPEPVAEILPRPVAVGPPVAGLDSAEADVALANAAALILPAPVEVKPAPEPATPVSPPPPASVKPVPPAILPDDTRPQVRAEDFLPYFQGPNVGGLSVPVSPGAPVAPPLPASSATYTQTPR